MVYDFSKRLLDISGAIFGLLIFLPFSLVVALLIKLDSEGPILVEHSTRVGKNGKTFRMYKFRSMIKNSHQILRTDPKYKEFLENYKKNNFKLDQDPRVTRVGSVLRKMSIDEIPQFWNVLKGEMSLVGPRAYYPDELEEQRKQYPQCKKLIEEALTVKPGISGLWQVSGRSKIGFEQRITLDAKYARSKSLALDLEILMKTPFAVLKGEGVI